LHLLTQQIVVHLRKSDVIGTGNYTEEEEAMNKGKKRRKK